ncbi:MAG: hypothetical protein AAF329_07715, partial [Cyanobacteria bacterium P01_A01_bin.17]
TPMLISKAEAATNARKEFFKILDEVAEDSSVVIVKRKDVPNVAIMADEFYALCQRIASCSSEASRKNIEKSLLR